MQSAVCRVLIREVYAVIQLVQGQLRVSRKLEEGVQKNF
jgi:hypothetical protein